MKVFSVSKACNACGECVLRTTLLTENSGGFAVPTPGQYIQDSDLLEAERVVAQCPVNALSIVDQSSVASCGKAGLEELAKVLEKRLLAVDIPDISSSDIAYRESDYSVDYGYISDEGRRIYSSERKAIDAGRQQFERMFWNRRADFVTDLLTQYKSKVLRKYYDLSIPDRSYYAEIGKKMSAILNEAMAEASSLAGKALPFSRSFTIFHPELDDQDFTKDAKTEYEKWIVMPSYVKSFCEGFERMEYQRKSYYEQYIMAESHETFEYDRKGRQKITHIYSFEGANEEGRDLVKDIIFYVGCAGACGLRPIDDLSTDRLNYMMERYRKLVKEEIAIKIAEFKKVIGQEGHNLSVDSHNGGVNRTLEEAALESKGTSSVNNGLDKKLVMLFKETSGCSCIAITENFLIFERCVPIMSRVLGFGFSTSAEDKSCEEILEEGKYCLNLRTLEIKKIPEHQRVLSFPVVLGDRLIYHMSGEGQVKYFDAAAMETGHLMDSSGSRHLDASDDYVLVCSGISESKLLNVKTGKIYNLNDGYGKILDGELYTLGHNDEYQKIYNPERGTTRPAKGITWDFWPEKVSGNKMYGTVHGIVSERDVKVMDRTTGSKRNLFKYYDYALCCSQISISDGYWVLADQKDHLKDPIVIRAINLETSEVHKIASIPPTCDRDIIGVINNWFYYRTQETVTKSDGNSETIWHIYKVSLANPEQNEEIS